MENIEDNQSIWISGSRWPDTSKSFMCNSDARVLEALGMLHADVDVIDAE